MALDPARLKALLRAELSEDAALDELAEELLPAIALRVNEELGRTVALHADDIIPTNQRNLTDVRTRMGMLLEYEFCRVANLVIQQAGLTNIAVTHVVAHKFPDLAVRFGPCDLGIRLELKAIEAIAEEKAANFDVMLKDILPDRDHVVVLLWEWGDPRANGTCVPVVEEIHVLNAMRLARMRDTYWLQSPPTSPGDGRQGFDMDGAVNCKDGKYNREEGNFGKLLRVFSPTHDKFLDEATLRSGTYKRYFVMRHSAEALGVEKVGTRLARVFAGPQAEIELTVPEAGIVAITGTSVDKLKIHVYGPVPGTSRARALASADAVGATAMLSMNSKFGWVLFTRRGGEWSREAEGNKPSGAQEAVARVSRAGG